MSRIHEALKRAEQEKAAQMQVGVRSTTPQAGNNTDPSIFSHAATSEDANDLEQGDRVQRTASGTSLQFEQLIHGCTHPEWKTDSAFRVSLTGDSGKVV